MRNADGSSRQRFVEQPRRRNMRYHLRTVSRTVVQQAGSPLLFSKGHETATLDVRYPIIFFETTQIHDITEHEFNCNVNVLTIPDPNVTRHKPTEEHNSQRACARARVRAVRCGAHVRCGARARALRARAVRAI